MPKPQFFQLTALRAALSRLAATFRSTQPFRWLMGFALASAAEYANASIFGTKLCNIYNGIADNSLYSMLAGIGLGGIMWANAVDEGGNETKTKALRVALAATGLVSLPFLSNLITGSTWGC